MLVLVRKHLKKLSAPTLVISEQPYRLKHNNHNRVCSHYGVWVWVWVWLLHINITLFQTRCKKLCPADHKSNQPQHHQFCDDPSFKNTMSALNLFNK